MLKARNVVSNDSIRFTLFIALLNIPRRQVYAGESLIIVDGCV